MAGDATKTSLWQGADVYVGAIDTAFPTDTSTAWVTGWNAVGLLDGEEGFTESRDGDSSEHYAWGGILYRRTSSKHKRSIKFVALEDNAVTFGLVNPGSTATTAANLRTRKIKAPTTNRFRIGFEVRDGARIKRRFGIAEVSEVADIKEAETDPTVYEITVVFFPDSNGVIYTDLEVVAP